VKTFVTPNRAELIQREDSILKTLKHPLILELRKHIFDTPDHNSAIETEFAGNGSLASHLPPSKCSLSGANRITRIIVGIALAMRFVHSQDVIHCDLRPDNILLDWDWNVRIADFGHSISPDNPKPPSLFQSNQTGKWPFGDSRYLAPECYDNRYYQESDVFSFGMILYELLSGQPAFSKELTQNEIAFRVILDDKPPPIPDSVLPSAQELITDCWAKEPGSRLSFEEIVDRLKTMKFKVMPNVNSQKLLAFVKKIEEFEERNAADPS
jgi:serine/threonine protein kinase